MRKCLAVLLPRCFNRTLDDESVIAMSLGRHGPTLSSRRITGNFHDMSKAFTKESDDDLPDAPMSLWLRPAPPGTKNYLTPAGARRLQEELTRLADIERPKTEALSDAAERKRQLQALKQRMAYLHQNLQAAEVVPPPTAPWYAVKFGATVTVRDRIGRENSYRIVGIDEADADRDWVSWQSPLARALLNARLGQRVRFQSPDGEEELEIVAIAYE